MKRAQQKYTYDKAYEILLFGYDVSVIPSVENDAYYTVTLKESGSEVFKRDIPNLSQDPDETEEQVLNNIAQAAIDLFESERGTLGLGAGADVTSPKKSYKRKKSMKKQSYISDRHEDWYMGFKGTDYEQQAYTLLEHYIDKEYEVESDPGNIDELYNRKRDIEYKLSKLDLERMSMMPAGPQVIIINAGTAKTGYSFNINLTEEYLDKFSGTPMESEVIKLLKEYIEVCESIDIQGDANTNVWQDLNDIDDQMDQLSYEAMYQNVLEKIPDEGIEAFPNMAGDLAELMEGVSLDEALLPQSGVLARKKKSFDEVELSEDRIHEMGEYTDGLDPAEVEYPEKKLWEKGDTVQTTKEVSVQGAGGSKKDFPSGTKGVIDSVWDKENLIYTVCLTDKDTDGTNLAQVPSDQLKSSK